MCKYTVFAVRADGLLHLGSDGRADSHSGVCFGMSSLDVWVIADGHRLGVGDVVNINGDWLVIRQLHNPARLRDLGHADYEYLPPLDTDVAVGLSEVWSLDVRSRLTRELDAAAE